MKPPMHLNIAGVVSYSTATAPNTTRSTPNNVKVEGGPILRLGLLINSPSIVETWANLTGFTLLEAVAALAIMVLAIGGTLMAFVTAERVTRNQNQPDYAEASGYAQQTAEHFRNRIDDDPATPAFTTGPTWQLDQPLPSPPAPPSPSILRQGATRQYRLTREDCDVNGVIDLLVDKCYAIEVKVSWTKPSG